ncbi:MAG: hypothetical protein HY784_06840 [Chloroflexi bacterium]|nr:hypothetical protein [Chloroflexota bacterium]
MTSPTPRLDLFAACPPGLEAVAAAEFFALGFQPAHPVPGGVELRGTLAHLYRANLCSRVAGRILLRLGEFHATAFDELRRKAAQLPWEAFLRPGGLLAFNVSAHKSRLIHTGAIEQRLAEAIGERLGQPSPADRAGQLILARLDHDACTLSVDTSGAPLHRRGYRLATAKAPLRETLAAAILLGSGYPGPGQPPIATIGGCPPARESAPGPGPLVDPFCGAGTIAIEAALLARRIAPGLRRSFAFESFPGFDPELSSLRGTGAGQR